MPVAIAADGDDLLVPVRIEQVARGDRAVVDAEVGIAHHLGDYSRLCGMSAHRFGQFDIDVEVVVVTEQVGEDRVDGERLEVRQAEEVGADVRLPVRREDDDGVVVDVLQLARQPLISPAQGLPSAFREGLVLLRVIGVDEVRGMRGQAAEDDLTSRHHRHAPDGPT